MNTAFFIKQASNNDIPTIKNIVFSVLREYGLNPDEKGKDNDLNDIEKNYLEQNGYFGLIAEDETGIPKGTFGLFKIDADTCELRKMYLLKESRGKGLGNLMMENAISIAKEKGYKHITLETIAPLKEAISLYKKFGFIEVQPKEVNSRVDQAYLLTLDSWEI